MILVILLLIYVEIDFLADITIEITINQFCSGILVLWNIVLEVTLKSDLQSLQLNILESPLREERTDPQWTQTDSSFHRRYSRCFIQDCWSGNCFSIDRIFIILTSKGRIWSRVVMNTDNYWNC